MKLLARVLTDRSPAVRKKTARALGGFGKDAAEATAPLVLLLADWDRGVVESARAALGKIGDDWPKTEVANKVIPALPRHLSDRSAYVRANAAKALGLFGKAADRLGALSKSKDADVQKARELFLLEINR